MAGKAPQRKSLPWEVKLKVWVRSGGRCVICNRYLLDGKLSGREVSFGELAHIVGQAASAASPRGLDELDRADRDDPDNLVLVCEDEHEELDKRGTRDLFGVELLRDMKRGHEARIRHVTDFAEDRSTVVLRMIGRLHGAAVEVSRDAIASAVIESAGRFPRFDLAFDRRAGVEIDLRSVPGEAAAECPYYAQATATIDQVIEHKFAEGAARDAIQWSSEPGWWPKPSWPLERAEKSPAGSQAARRSGGYWGLRRKARRARCVGPRAQRRAVSLTQVVIDGVARGRGACQ